MRGCLTVGEGGGMLNLLTDLCCGLILMALPSGGPGAEGWEKIFTQNYATMQTAIARHDTVTLGAMLTPDFVAYDVDGAAMNAPQLLAAVAARPDNPGRVAATQLLSVNIKGFNNSARVTHRDTVRTQESDADGHRRDVSTSSIIVDDWVRLYGVWLLRHRETAVFDQFADGRQVMHRLRGDLGAVPTLPVMTPPPPVTGGP